MNKINLIEYFESAEKHKMINQASGAFISQTRPCCVGAHLAFAIMDGCSFNQGKNALKEHLIKIGFKDINLIHIEHLLNKAGIYKPWGATKWKIKPSVVFKKLLKIEKLPCLKNLNFINANFIAGEFTNNLLEQINFSECGFTDATFNNCTLKNCNFSRDFFQDSTIINCKVLNCKFEATFFLKAIFEKTNFKDCEFINVNFNELVWFNGENPNKEPDFVTFRNCTFKGCEFPCETKYLEKHNKIISYRR